MADSWRQFHSNDSIPNMTEFLQIPWVQRSAFLLGGLLIGFVLERVVVARARSLAAKTRFQWDDLIADSVRGVPTIWLACAGIYLAVNVGTVDPLVSSTIVSVLTVILIGSVAIGDSTTNT